MHYACLFQERDTQRGVLCLHSLPSIRIKVFIHLCVNKLVNFAHSFSRFHLPTSMAKIGKNNWVNKFWSGWKMWSVRGSRHGQCMCMQWKKTNIIFVTFLFTEWSKQKTFNVKKAIDNHCQQQTQRRRREWMRIWKCYHRINFNENHFGMMENENEKSEVGEGERLV